MFFHGAVVGGVGHEFVEEGEVLDEGVDALLGRWRCSANVKVRPTQRCRVKCVV